MQNAQKTSILTSQPPFITDFRYRDTTANKKIFSLRKRIRAVKGGTGASKTVGILIWLIDYAQSTKDKVVSVVSESYPHLSLGAIREFKQIMLDRGYWVDDRWVGSPTPVYTFETGTIIEFISMDKLGKAHGPRRDILFITLIYLDNEGLDEGQLNEILAHKNNSRWWKVYGLGELGDVEGRIFQTWQIIDEIPHEARLERFGLDFGYTNDPSALVSLYYFNGGYILDEVVFQKGLSNKQLADIILNQKKALVIGDSAEPKSIDEIRSFGVNILPTVKGKDSVRQGIQVVQDQQISVTKRSINIIKEYRHYMWETDKDGRILNEPEHTWSHSMDAIRYAMASLTPIIRRKEMIDMMPVFESKVKTNPAV